MLDEIFSWLGQIVIYGGGSVAIAFAAFKVYGERWLENSFNERLNAIQHQYNVELQRLKARLDAAASGMIRQHQKEFEVLPEAYGLLDEAMGLLRWVTAPFQQYANVSQLGEEDLKEFLDGAEFSKSNKQYILDSSNRQDAYIKVLEAQKTWKAETAIRAFHNYTARNGIFLPEELRKEFDSIREVLWAASVSKSVGREATDHKMQMEGWTKLEEIAKPKFEKIRELIQARIKEHASLDLTGLVDPR